MKLNLATDYGLRVLVYLLARPDERAQVETIARCFDISGHHLMKVVQRLAQAGLLVTYRGRSGGIALARPPEDINLGAVVEALEPDFALVECFSESGGACCLSPACRLKGIVAEAVAAFVGTFSRYTLADLRAPGLAELLGATPPPGRKATTGAEA